MRTIKFRGYSKDFTENEWFFGNLIDKGNGCFQILEKNPKIWDLSYDGITVIPESIGQFTRLHDKNGKEIYEGDVLNFGNNNPVEVKFENGAFTVFSEPLGWDFDSDDMPILTDFKYCEIIGNSFENPELLEKKFAD